MLNQHLPFPAFGETCDNYLTINALSLGLFIVEGILADKSDILVINDLLCTSDKEDSTRAQISIILSENIILRFFSEVDKNVTTNDKVTILWIRVS